MGYQRTLWENDERSYPFALAFEKYYTDWILVGLQWSNVGMAATAPGGSFAEKYTEGYKSRWEKTIKKVDEDYDEILQAEKDIADPDVKWTTLVKYLMWMISDTIGDIEAAKKVGYIIDKDNKFLEFSKRHLERTKDLLRKYRDKV